MRHLLRVILLTITIADYGFATTYYVSPAGSDSHTGTGEDSAHAWLTIQHAADTMIAGDVVNVLAGTSGTYSQRVSISQSGSAVNRIIYNGLYNGLTAISTG